MKPTNRCLLQWRSYILHVFIYRGVRRVSDIAQWRDCGFTFPPKAGPARCLNTKFQPWNKHWGTYLSKVRERRCCLVSYINSLWLPIWLFHHPSANHNPVGPARKKDADSDWCSTIVLMNDLHKLNRNIDVNEFMWCTSSKAGFRTSTWFFNLGEMFISEFQVNILIFVATIVIFYI